MNKRTFHFGIYCLALLSISFVLVSAITAHSASQETGTCPGAPVSRLVAGEQGRVGPEGANNVRSEPAASGQLLGQISGGGLFIVLEGPVCAEGFAWWRVDHNGLVGWTAEGQGGDYWLEPAGPLPTPAPTSTTDTSEPPACPNAMPSRLIVGERGRVVPGPANNVRAEPSSSADKVGEIPGGAGFLVLEGPVCAEGFAWWRVDYSGLNGWTPEGSGDTYWLEPAGPVPTLAPTLTPSITPTPRPTFTPAPTLTPTPTFTPAPPMPPVQVFEDRELLLDAPLPAERQAITPDNAHLLQPVAIFGEGGVDQLAVSPDGQLIAVMNGLGIWLSSLDDETGNGMLLEMPQLAASSLAFNTDGSILAAGGTRYTGMSAPTLMVWDTDTGQQLPLFDRFDQTVYALAFSPNGRWLAAGGARQRGGGGVWLFDINTQQMREIPMDMTNEVRSVAFDANSATLAASSRYGEIKLFSLEANEHQIAYQVQADLGDVLFSADGGLLLSAGGGGETTTPGVLRIWDVVTAERVLSPRFETTIDDLSLSPDGNLLAIRTAGVGGYVWIWDMEDRAELTEINIQTRPHAMTFTADGTLATGHADGIVRLWDARSGEKIRTLRDYSASGGDLFAISPDGAFVATASNQTGEIRLIDSATREVIGTFDDDVGTVSYLAFDPDGVELRFRIGERRYIWNLETGTQEQTTAVFDEQQPDAPDLTGLARTLYPPSHPIYSVTQVPKSPLLLVHDGSTLTFWNTETRIPVASYRYFGQVRGFNHDGTALITTTGQSWWLWAIPQ